VNGRLRSGAGSRDTSAYSNSCGVPKFRSLVRNVPINAAEGLGGRSWATISWASARPLSLVRRLRGIGACPFRRRPPHLPWSSAPDTLGVRERGGGVAAPFQCSVVPGIEIVEVASFATVALRTQRASEIP
jgi:hypothetical protein